MPDQPPDQPSDQPSDQSAHEPAGRPPLADSIRAKLDPRSKRVPGVRWLRLTVLLRDIPEM